LHWGGSVRKWHHDGFLQRSAISGSRPCESRDI